MPQTGQAVKTVPNVRVTISAEGIPDKPSVEVVTRGIVEFRSDTDRSWEVDFIDSDGNDFFPLTVFVPAHGSVWCVANSQQDNDACDYTILPFGPQARKAAKRPGPDTTYVIVIGGGKPGPKGRK
jgi:hypothetical protein